MTAVGLRPWQLTVDVFCGLVRSGELSAAELVEALGDIRAAVRDYPGDLEVP